MKKIVVIGAGVGGLTAAALLARAGMDVTVLEAHVYPGGCAATFYHQGYRFDAGATLPCGFYPGGPFDRVAQAAGIDGWPAQPSAAATMVVHLPGGPAVTRYGDERRWAEYSAAFGARAGRFWRWQEATADDLWALAMRLPAWPPQMPAEALRTAGHGLRWLAAGARRRLPGLALDAVRPVAAHLAGAPAAMRLFVDAQLLIAAQTTGRAANALYGAAALDLPRRGLVHLHGGMGTIAALLAEAVCRHGGRVLLRHEATRVIRAGGSGAAPWLVETRRDGAFPADAVLFNLPPWNVARLLPGQAPGRLARLPDRPRDGWGAFMVYVGLDGGAVPAGGPLHHQVVSGEPLGEGNSVFMSFSPAWDAGRAPAGGRALTISTHTALEPWWARYEHDRPAYEALKAEYTERVLRAAEVALPGLRAAARLVLPGTPVSFQRFTRRAWGWVGGWPQTNLLRAWGPRLGRGLWLVGDSIFPGQSVAAVALGGMRVAEAILGGPAI